MRRFRTFGETKKRGGIPDDCYEVEWLKVNGGAYIELDYFTGNRLRVQFKATYQTSSAEQDIICNQDNSTGRFVVGAASSKWFAYSRSSSKQDTNSWSDAITAGTTYEVVADYDSIENEKALSVDGVGFAKTSCTTIANTNKKVRLFRNTSGGYPFNGEVYYLKLDKNGSPWYDLVPVRREEDGVSVGYMCDRLTGTLYGNAGSGSFVIGPDKYDAEVEYLESVEARKAGSQITFPVGDRATFECKLHIFDTIDLKFMGLMYNEGGAYQGCFQISTILGGYRTQAPFMGTLSVDTPPVDITRPIVYKSPDPNHLYWTIDGVQYPVGACRWNTAGNFHLFHAGVLNYWNDKGRNRLYWCKVYEDGVLTRDFIPVRYRGVGYMYDNVSGRLFGNQGSGEFVIGADVKHAKDYVQDGLVAMWDGIENAGWGVHDESATYWADLVSDLRMSPLSDSYYQPGDMYGSFTTQCTQLIPKELWGGDHVKNITQSALVDMDSVASNAFFTLLYCYASPAAYRYGINTNASRRLTGDHITMLSTADSALYTQGIHRFDHVVSENTSGGTDEKLYIDGVEIVSARKTTAFSATETTQMRFYFYANIRAYNMMHYKRALTDAEIAANYAVDKVRFGI